MSLQFILGGSGCGKTYYAQHFISREAVHFPDRQYIFLVPEQFTMQTQKELISISASKGIMNIDVQSFVRLAFRVFEETGAGNLPVLDDMGKTMVLKKVLTQMEGELEYFGRNIHKEGYVQEIKSFLSELYQYGIDEDTLSEMIASAKKQPLLVRKLQDMQKIFRGFSDYLAEHFITSEEVLTVLAGVTEESGILRDSVVCLDGFTGFTPTQYQFIERLLPIAKKVYVTVTIDRSVSIVKPGAKHGLFYMSQQTIFRLRKMAQAHGIEVCPEIWTGEEAGETRFSQAPGIAALERGLFRYPMEEYGEEPEDISIHIMRQPEQEVEFVAEQIRGLLLRKDARYRDIAVITGDLSVYGTLAGEILERAGIPYFVDQKKSIEEHPFVELLQQTIQIFLSNFEAEKVMAFKKNIFSHGTLEEGDLLDNFLRATGIRGYKKWQEVWKADTVFFLGSNQGDSDRDRKERQQEIDLILDTARQDTLDELGELYEAVGKGKHRVREYAAAFCEWMEEERYFEKIQRQAELFGVQGERALQWEYQQVYGIVLGVFDRLVELLGEEEMDLREFREILTTGFSEARVGLIPPGVDQVVIGDMNRTRLAHVKYLFFLGMNDGNIPASGGGGGVISDSERLFLAEEEYELAPTLREKIYTEQFYLYLNLTKPSRHLYLTYCETGNDGKGKNPAYIIDRIKRMYPKLIPVVEENRQDDSYLLGNSYGADYLIRGLRDRNFQGKKWREIYRYYRENAVRRKQVDRLVDAAFYREDKTMISKEVARELYREILTGSTSQFEQYAACAFAYFMRYGLKLRERQEHQVAFFDIGNIVHKALELYTREMIAQGENWGDISEAEQNARGEKCVLRAVEEYRNDLLHHTERDTYLITRLKRILQRTIWAITKQMERGKFTTVESEISFEVMHRTRGEEIEEDLREENGEGEGKAGNLREVNEGEGLLRLVGKIDRTDKMEEGGTSYIKIVDYKTGKKNISLSDLYYGLQMQLLVYLKAGVDQEKQDGGRKKIVIPAGVLYYHIDDPMVEGKGEQEDIQQQILKELRMDGLLNEDDPVLPSIDDALAGEQGLAANVSSSIMPIATNRDGSLKKTSKAVTTSDFEDLMEFTEEKLKAIRDEIMAGHAEVNPYRKTDSTGENACAYCAYRGICRFDTKLPGNTYRMIDKLSDDDVLRKIKEGNK